MYLNILINIIIMNTLSLIGKGGFVREIYHHFNKHNYIKINIVNDIDNNLLNIKNSNFLICIGNTLERENIYNKYNKLSYFTYIHDNHNNLDNNNIIGTGSIICRGSILTTNIILGNHCQVAIQYRFQERSRAVS